MPLVYVSVERSVIAQNKLLAPVKRKPPFCVEYEDGREETHHWEIEFCGPSRLVYRPEHTQPGVPDAVAWIEAEEGSIKAL